MNFAIYTVHMWSDMLPSRSMGSCFAQNSSISHWAVHQTIATLKSDEALRTSHWRTMASLAMPFSSLLQMRTLQRNIIITQDSWIRNVHRIQGESLSSIVDSVFEKFSIQLHPIYLSILDIGWGCVPNCFMLSSLPCFPAFCWSAIPTSHYILRSCVNLTCPDCRSSSSGFIAI